ncbi:MAG: serine--tRNA ligase [Patescibacteria group bacterium]
MIDIKLLRENPEEYKQAAKNKNINIDIDRLLELDEKKRKLITETEKLRAERNEISSETKGTKPSQEMIDKSKEIKEKIIQLEKEAISVEEEYDNLMIKAPIIPSADTPICKDETGNVVVKQYGKPKEFKFEPKTHIELAKNLDWIDFERGVKVAGYRGYFLKNDATRIVMAMMMHAINKMTAKGYTPMIVPTIVKEFALFGSGYFKGKEYNSEVDEIYQIATSDKEADGTLSKEKKFLVGTAEPSLLAYFSGEVLKEEDLPIRVCGFSPCYRSEIGGYGKDTKGLYRVHEFFKVEQVIISKADIEESDKLQQEMVAISRSIHEDLEFTYRQVQICTGDMSAGKYKQFDLETWLPGSKRWAETGSASNFLDWQARRLNIKYVTKDGEKKYVYLLNDTALPSPRPLMAIMENYQQKDGTIKVPKILQKYIGIKKIG